MAQAADRGVEPVHEAKIGFGFIVDGRPMDAGTYTIEPVAAGAFWLRNRKSGRSAFFSAPVLSQGKPGPGELGFRCYAEGCTLQRLRFGGSGIGYEKPDPAGGARRYTMATVRLVAP